MADGLVIHREVTIYLNLRDLKGDKDKLRHILATEVCNAVGKDNYNKLFEYLIAEGEDNGSKPAYCPSCKYFGLDCSPDPEEYNEPCDAYEERKEG